MIRGQQFQRFAHGLCDQHTVVWVAVYGWELRHFYRMAMRYCQLQEATGGNCSGKSRQIDIEFSNGSLDPCFQIDTLLT